MTKAPARPGGQGRGSFIVAGGDGGAGISAAHQRVRTVRAVDVLR